MRTSSAMCAAGLLAGIAAAVASFYAAATHATDALTLDQFYAAALKRSEVVATQSELIRQAEEHYHQAMGALYPTVNGVASYTWQEPTAVGASSTAVFPTQQPFAKLAATQPLFRGFREYAALRQTEALLDAQNGDYASARLQLFKDVAQNFYNVLTIEQDLVNLAEEINQYLKREAELNDRVRIGRSRISEVLTVQSTINTLRAQVEQQQGQLRATREVFAFLSGLDSTTPLRDTEALAQRLEPLDEYLVRAALRPDVKAAQKRLAAAQENVTVARGAHYPSLDLNGNYYLERAGILKDVTWDVQIALTVPIFAGGNLQSKVREALSQQTQVELGASQITRQAEQEIRSLYQSVGYEQSQLEALEKATATARQNYEAQSREYRLGLVTNLDVLQALTAFQENQRALDRARFAAKLDFLRLQTAATRRPELTQGTTP